MITFLPPVFRAKYSNRLLGVWPRWKNGAKWHHTYMHHTYMHSLHNIVLPHWVISRPPHCAPILRSTHAASFALLSDLGRKWLHIRRMSPHDQTTTPFTPGRRSAESRGSASVCVWNVCEGGLWSIVSGQWFEWLMFSCERSCGMSGMYDCPCTYVCFFLFRKVCVCVCAHQSGRWRHMTWTWTLLIVHLCSAWLEVCMGGLRCSFKVTHEPFFGMGWQGVGEWPLKMRTEQGHFPHTDVMI